MKKIEHAQFFFTVAEINNGKAMEHIKNIQQGGWEMCGIAPIFLDNSGTSFIYYFKRISE